VKVFFFFLLKKIIILFIVLLITLFITIFLLGSTFDQIMKDSIRAQVIGSISSAISKNPNIHQFKNSDERQKFIDQQIKLQSQSLGLDEPWYSPKKLFNDVLKIITLDLGKSRFATTFNGSSSVNDLILEKMPYTILLFTSSSITIILISLVFGAYLASKEGKTMDKFISGFASISLGVPTWWFSMIMIVFFSFYLRVLPSGSTPLIPPNGSGYTADLLYHMTLPFITLVIIGFAPGVYYVKYIVSRILNEDFIKTLKIMGIPQKSILYKHALKNAGPQLTTMFGLGLAGTLGGSVLVEQIFDWPGMGNLFYNAIFQSDSPLIIGLVYFFALIYLLTRLILDVCFTYFDPRIKSGES
jgi:peptide/nickel transport system permease protein